jgi:uncharacterized protein (DUF934 family)
MRKQANALLKALSDRTGMEEELRLGGEDTALCALGGVLTTFVYADELEEMIVNAILFPLPADAGRGETVAALMRGNYSWGGTDGGVIGVDDDTGQVVLSRRFQMENETAESFVEKIERMCGLALYWRGNALPREAAPAAPGIRA